MLLKQIFSHSFIPLFSTERLRLLAKSVTWKQSSIASRRLKDKKKKTHSETENEVKMTSVQVIGGGRWRRDLKLERFRDLIHRLFEA